MSPSAYSQRTGTRCWRARLVWLLVLSLLAGCSVLRPTVVPPYELAPTVTPPAAAADPAAITRIRARGVLRVGIRFDLAPFGFVTEDGDLAGFDVDLAHELARRWLGAADKVDFYQITTRTAGSKLGGDGVDILLGALPRDRALESMADFAQPYYAGGPGLLVRAGMRAASLGDLANTVVAVDEGSSAASVLAEGAAAAGITITVNSYVTHSMALEALATGEVFALAGDSTQLAADALGQAEFALAPLRLRPSYAAPAVPQGDTIFREVLDFTLQDMRADGTYARLYEKWFAGDTPLPLDAWPGKAPFDFRNAPLLAPGSASAVDRLRAGQPLRVGVLPDQPGWSVLNADGTADGFVVELVNAMMGRWISSTATAEFVAVTPESGLAELAAGRIDLLATPLTASAELLDRADVSVPYFQDGQALLVLPRQRYAGLADLAGLTVAAATPEAVDVLRAALDAQGISATIDLYAGPDVALAAWDASVDIHAVAARLVELGRYNRARDDVKLVGPLLAPGPQLVFGLPVADGRLRDVVNFTLQTMAADGGYDEVWSRWYSVVPAFVVPQWPGTPGDVGVNLQARP